MEIAAFKVAICQCWPSAIPTCISRATKSNWCKINVFGFRTQISINAPNFSKQTMSYEGDMIFQRWQLNSASKQVSWRNEFKLHSEASKPISKFLFQQFSSSKSKFEDFMQDYFSFFRKIVIEVLNCKLSTWGRTIL